MVYQNPPERPDRPGTPPPVHVVAAFHYVAGVLALLAAAAVALAAAGRQDLSRAELPPELRDTLASLTIGAAAGLTALGVGVIFLGRRLQMGRRWAWLLLMALCVPSAVLTFVGGLEGRRINLFVGLVLPVVYVILLGGSPVRQWYRAQAGRPPASGYPPAGYAAVPPGRGYQGHGRRFPGHPVDRRPAVPPPTAGWPGARIAPAKPARGRSRRAGRRTASRRS